MYKYEEEKQFVFTDEGQRLLLHTRDALNALTACAGACTVDRVFGKISAGSFDSWNLLACIDRLVELGEFSYVDLSNAVATQHRILRKGPRS